MHLNSELRCSVELHDSTVVGIEEVGSQIILFLTMYIHKTEGRPGWDAGSGFIQAAAIVFSDGELAGEIPELPADISDGSLTVDAEVLRNMIPIPFSFSGQVSLALNVVGPASLAIGGSRAELTLIGDAAYVEKFVGADTAAS